MAIDYQLPTVLEDEQASLCARFEEAALSAGLAITLDDATRRVFAISPFLAEFAIRRPQDFVSLQQNSAASTPEDYSARVEQTLALCSDTAAAKRALRTLRQAVMAQIAWRDIHLAVPLTDTITALSDFADCILQKALAWLQHQLTPRFGQPKDDAGEPLELLILAMGKLGGQELNFSSDIDLIFIYGQNGLTQGGRRELEHQEYFDRLGRELISLLNETTAEGFVFRVDMRLRPFGDSGPLSCSLDALEHYYAVHGRDWERYALIKARAVTGDPRTRQRLEQLVRPFVYRRYLDFGALEALREMKAVINTEATSDALHEDVKRGRGGIREVEFTGQLFQLMRGGREPDLRQPSLLAILAVCVDRGYLEAPEVETLLAGYTFLRTVEHRLQQVRDQQTHRLPQELRDRARLAYAMALPSWSAFTAVLNRHRSQVNAVFSRLLEAPAVSRNSEDRLDSAARSLWLEHGDESTLAQRAMALGHPLSEAQLDFLQQLRAQRFLERLSRQGRERLDRLMPLLIRTLLLEALPDQCLRYLLKLLQAIARRSVYVSFLADNPDALQRLLALFAISPWIADQIIAHPLLLDELLDSRALFAPPDAVRLRSLIAQQVRPEDGLEQTMEGIRVFRNQQVLRVAASDVMGRLPVAEVSNQLSFIAETCIESALGAAWHELTQRFGAPMHNAHGRLEAAAFGVVAYGKLGGLELGYGSDLDLVFVHDSGGSSRHTAGPKEIENDVFFARLAQRFTHILNTTTSAGVAYEVDTRLRPSGNSGLPVSQIDSFATYLADEAWTWELQALVRARPVAGDAGLRERFAAIRSNALVRPRDALELKTAVAEMRARMVAETDRSTAQAFDLKRGVGGMTDIEFMVQYAVLRWAAEHPALVSWTDNLRLLETIADLELLPATACRQLRDAYFAYRADIHQSALQQVDGLVDQKRFLNHRRQVSAVWQDLFE